MSKKTIETADVLRILNAPGYSDTARKFCLRILASRASRLGCYISYTESISDMRAQVQEMRNKTAEMHAMADKVNGILTDIIEM